MSDDKLITGTPAGTNMAPIAEGTREFRANPEDFMDILMGGRNPTTIQEAKNFVGFGNKTAPRQDTSDKDAMKEILERFYDTTEYAVDKTLRENTTKKDLKRALISEEFSEKEWTIQLNDSNESKTTYDVVNKNARKSFFNGIYLEEAAKKLCALLEENAPLNSPKISKILYLDEMYKKHFDDAMVYKRNHKVAMRKRNNQKAAILESRFDVAKEKALSYKKQLKKL